MPKKKAKKKNGRKKLTTLYNPKVKEVRDELVARGFDWKEKCYQAQCVIHKLRGNKGKPRPRRVCRPTKAELNWLIGVHKLSSKKRPKAKRIRRLNPMGQGPAAISTNRKGKKVAKKKTVARKKKKLPMMASLRRRAKALGMRTKKGRYTDAGKAMLYARILRGERAKKAAAARKKSTKVRSKNPKRKTTVRRKPARRKPAKRKTARKKPARRHYW